MTEITNPVVQEMLDELRDERPDIWPLVQQWLAHPGCLHVIHFLDSLPAHAVAGADLLDRFAGAEAELPIALDCLLEHRIIVRQEVPEAGMVFYRLNNREPEQTMMDWFRAWCRRWRGRLRAAEEVLGVGWHWGEERHG